MENKNGNTLYEKIFQIEERKLENLNVIYLIKDSNNSQWYKAYEWSAYLLEFITNKLEEPKRLKPTNKQFANLNNTLINVGIPITSLDKFCDPNLIIDKYVDANQHMTIKIQLPTDINFENYKQKLTEWKNTIPIKSNQPNKINKSTNLYNQPTTFLNIMKEIIRFNIYNREKDELIEFINDLKIKCADLIC